MSGAAIPPPTTEATGQGRATLALVLAAFLWGSTFLVVQDATDHAGVLPFLAARFLIAALILWPLARRRAVRPDDVKHGVIAGTLFLGGYVLQTAGLQYTTTSSSAFITYLLVVLVPMIDAAMLRSLPAFSTVAGVALAVVGLVLLSGGSSGFGKGEVLTLGGAVCFAFHLVYLSQVTNQHDAVRLTYVQVLTVGLGCVVPGFFTGGYAFGWPAWGAAVGTGVGATAIAVLCMVWAQRIVPPARTAILLLLEPVFAAILGYVVGERLGGRGLVGAVLILAAVLLTELVPGRAGRPVEPHHADV